MRDADLAGDLGLRPLLEEAHHDDALLPRLELIDEGLQGEVEFGLLEIHIVGREGIGESGALAVAPDRAVERVRLVRTGCGDRLHDRVRIGAEFGSQFVCIG